MHVLCSIVLNSVIFKEVHFIYYITKVIEKGCSLNDTILKSKGVDRYGRILSKHFETAWKKKNTEGKQSFLQFTLSWPSFFHFLNMFCKF